MESTISITPEVGMACTILLGRWGNHAGIITKVSDSKKTITFMDLHYNEGVGRSWATNTARLQPDGTYRFYGITVIVGGVV